MSVDLKHYLGYGIKIDTAYNSEAYNKVENKVDALEEAGYELAEEHKNNVGKVRVISDGMCGEFIYIIHVLQETEEEDMYSSKANVAIPLSSYSIESLNEIKEIAAKILGVNEADVPEIQLHSFYLCT